MTLEQLIKAHESLLNTLSASRNPWIVKVHKNAKAHYEFLKTPCPSCIMEPVDGICPIHG